MSSPSIFDQTTVFNKCLLGLPEPASPTRLDPERKDWTMTALIEELEEFSDAETLEDEVDALLDLIYFAGGRLYEMGVDGKACFDEVHRANMQKAKGALAKRPGSRGYDAIKPAGWTPPNLKPLLTSAQVYRDHELDGMAVSRLTPGGFKPVNCRNFEAGYLHDERLGKALVDATYGKPPVSDTGFMKFDDSKDCMPELIPAPALEALGRLYATGAKKYAAENWRKGSSFQRYVGALDRHLLEWRMGRDYDSQTGGTGEHHLIQVAWNAITLFMQQRLEIGTDDRPDRWVPPSDYVAKGQRRLAEESNPLLDIIPYNASRDESFTYTGSPSPGSCVRD